MNLVEVRIYGGFLSESRCRYGWGVFACPIANVCNGVAVYIVHEKVSQVFFISLTGQDEELSASLLKKEKKKERVYIIFFQWYEMSRKLS